MKFTPRTFVHDHEDHGTFFITHSAGRFTASRVYGPGHKCEVITSDAPSYGRARRACLQRATELDAQPERAELARVG